MLPGLLQVVQRADDGATVLDGSLVGAHGGVPTRIAQGLGAGGLIRGDERVQIVGVLEMQVAEQPALGEGSGLMASSQRNGLSSAAGSVVWNTKVGEPSRPCSMTWSMVYS